MKKLRLAACFLLVLAGCGGGQVKQMKLPVWIPQQAHWPELDAVVTDPGPEAGFSLSKLAQEVSQYESAKAAPEGSEASFEPRSFQEAFSEPGFKARLKAFTDAPLPDAYDSVERQQAKADFVKGWQEMEKLARSGATNAPALAQFAKLDNAYRRLVYIPGQTPPTGSAAEKYSSVAPYDNPHEKK